MRQFGVEPSDGQHRPLPLVATLLAVAVCAITLRVAASTDPDAPTARTTFASAAIDCAPSPGATEQVFLNVDATDKEIIVARIAIASVPGVTIDEYLDHDAAFRQLACLFPGAPDALHGIRPVELPVSFAITTTGADSTPRVRAIPNVLGIVTPETWDAWVAKIGQ